MMVRALINLVVLNVYAHPILKELDVKYQSIAVQLIHV
jgi:hypothetical protein